MPSDWEIVKIAALYSLRNTKVSDEDFPPLSVTMQGILPQVETASKTNDHDNRKLVRKGDFAINSRSDRRGSCGISDYDGSVSLINTVLKPNRKMNSRYYNWLFHTPLFADEFYKWGHGIVDDLWTTGWQEMKKITVPFPSITEQERISDFLDAKCAEIDALTADIEKQIETLEQYKRSVITEAVTKGLNPDVEMKDSGIEWIGKIPLSWPIIPLKYTFGIISGSTPDSSNADLWDGDINWVTPADFKTKDYYVTSGHRNISALGYRSCSTNMVPENSIIFSKRAPIGSVVINKSKLCTNQGCLACVPKVETNVKFYYYIMSVCEDVFNLFGSGTTFKEISATVFGNMRFQNPPVYEQNLIVTFLDYQCSKIDSMISSKEQQIGVLEDYKKSLIYEYVTGKKEVV